MRALKHTLKMLHAFKIFSLQGEHHLSHYIICLGTQKKTSTSAEQSAGISEVEGEVRGAGG